MQKLQKNTHRPRRYREKSMKTFLQGKPDEPILTFEFTDKDGRKIALDSEERKTDENVTKLEEFLFGKDSPSQKGLTIQVREK